MLLYYGQAAAGLLPAGSDALSRRTALGAAAAALTSRSQPAAASRPAEAQPVGASASDQRLLLDSSASIVDSSQEYDRARSVLYDTRSGSFLPPEPRRYVAAALHRREAEQCAPRSAAGGAAAACAEGEARVIFAAEDHLNPLHHVMQLEMIKAVDALDERPFAIGLEMFYRQHQPALDAFVFQDGSFANLKKRTRWATTWGYDFNQYAKILAYARRHGIQLVGLNVPFGLVNAVANTGLDELSDKFKAQLPADIDRGQVAHFERFERDIAETVERRKVAMPDAPELQRWYEAELLWDEYVAESIANYMAGMQRAGNGDARLVVLAAASRVQARDGVPDRVSRRTGGRTFTMLPLAVPWAANGLPAIRRPLGPAEADWLLYTQTEISRAPRRVAGAFGSSAVVGLDKPRISPDALRLGTAAAPIIEL